MMLDSSLAISKTAAARMPQQPQPSGLFCTPLFGSSRLGIKPFWLFLILSILLLNNNNSMAATAPHDPEADEHASTTHYQVLQVTPSATLQEIKKSYRKLALLHHPDRNPPEKKEEATVLFRRVNEAYEVLSDPEQRRQYDLELKGGRTSAFHHGSSSGSNPAFHHHHRHRRHNYRDPFMQFNDLFQNDPFFQEAFKDMDDLFAKTFQAQHPSQQSQQQHQQQQRAFGVVDNSKKQQPKSWGRWIADCLGIDFQIQTSTTTIGPDGRPQTSSTQTSYGNSRRRQHSTYTSKSTRTVIENGRRVTIQSLEKDGNKIEEKYVNNELVQRLINGVPEQQYRIDTGRTDL
ncbi:protein DnaJ [Seminavis robusta]|uniref:Protein DnaJ n=1 Tax=Seminavis robusta TaxID=568900 RepID=A0A9N8EZ29_9STRA|nr:protein DnaJ [Seminavis robusta]|eukprot:Sro2509_g329750.1 protein DnaJ (346) ;mRNA; f:1712-2749